MSEVFRYAIDKKFVPLWLPFGVRPWRDGVTLTDDGRFVATFGFLRVVMEPVFKVVAAGSGVIGAANGGVVQRERVGSVLRPSGHSALTVTVADLEGLVRALSEGSD